MVENRNTSIEEETTDFLNNLGFSTKIVGYEYLKLAIEYCVAGNGMERVKQEKINSYVANHFNIINDSVNSGILRAIEKVWNTISFEKEERYFGNTIIAEKGKPTNLEFIAMAVRIIKNQFSEDKLFKTLNDIGMPAHIKGRYYLELAIKYCTRCKKNNGKAFETTTELYNYVAEKCKTKISYVEKSIRHAITLTWERADCDTLEKVFKGKIKGKKPTNTEFITVISEMVDQ